MKDKCLNPQCKNKVHSRGLCMGCYQRAQRMIDYGEATEEEMIARGKILAPFAGKKCRWFDDKIKYAQVDHDSAVRALIMIRDISTGDIEDLCNRILGDAK